MAFSLIHTWASGETFTSTQANAIAQTLVKALDKSISGDTISGSISIAATGQISVDFSAGIAVNAAGGLVGEVAGGIIAGTTGGIQDGGIPGGIQGTVAGGISPTVAGGISDGGIVEGIKATVGSGIWTAVAGGISTGVAGGIAPSTAGGISDGGIAGGIHATIAGGISTAVAGGIRPTAGGSITDGGIAGGLGVTAVHGLAVTGSGSVEVQSGGAIDFASGGLLTGAATVSAHLASTGGVGGSPSGAGAPFIFDVVPIAIASTGTSTLSTTNCPIIQIQITGGGNLTGNVTIDLAGTATGTIYFLDTTTFSVSGHTIAIKNGGFTTAGLSPTSGILVFCSANNRVSAIPF